MTHWNRLWMPCSISLPINNSYHLPSSFDATQPMQFKEQCYITWNQSVRRKVVMRQFFLH